MRHNRIALLCEFENDQTTSWPLRAQNFFWGRWMVYDYSFSMTENPDFSDRVEETLPRFKGLFLHGNTYSPAPLMEN